jgi:hypothetical protein
MLISRIKGQIVALYNYFIALLPVRLANRLIWIDRQSNWSISIYEGNNFRDLQPTTVVANPVLTRSNVTDIVAAFVADPFMVKVDDDWLMFFEVFNYHSHKGEIAFARSQDGYRWNYQQIILAEDFHLSYPYVFEFASTWYMIPESCEANSIRLYRAKKFPDTWEFVKEISIGSRFVDASILNFNDVWWLFVGIEPTDGAACSLMKLYYTDSLLGDWVEHPKSPIVSDRLDISRPAGRMQIVADRPIRFTQDCTKTYGYNVSAIAIESLTKSTYVETKIQPESNYLFELGTMSCNRIGMHHIDFVRSDDDRCIASVDAR